MSIPMQSDPLRDAERIAAQIDSADPDERIQGKLARIEQALDARENERRARLATEMHHDGTPREPEPEPSLDGMGGPLEVDSFEETEQAVRWGVEYLIVRAKLATTLEARIRVLDAHIERVRDLAGEIEDRAQQAFGATRNDVVLGHTSEISDMAEWLRESEPGQHYLSRGERQDTPPHVTAIRGEG